jgi:streptomycin 6-kinase
MSDTTDPNEPMPMPMPRRLLEAAELYELRPWFTTLPAAIRRLEQTWSLTLGPPFQPGGMTAWVAPARDPQGRPVVLKVGHSNTESLHEADALRVWAGQGTIRLYAEEQLGDDTFALLLERAEPGTTLATRPEPEQDEVIAGLLSRLWQVPTTGHDFRPLQQMCDEWAAEFEAKAVAGRSDLDPGVAREGIALFRTLPATADTAVLLCTDLHAENVLAAEREPWLVIDPCPYVGDPAYDPLQHMLNCPQRLQADPHGLVARMADLLDLDRERLLLWLFARCVQESPEWPGLSEVARRVAPG